jgi:hypothetical protein
VATFSRFFFFFWFFGFLVGLLFSPSRVTVGRPSVTGDRLAAEASNSGTARQTAVNGRRRREKKERLATHKRISNYKPVIHTRNS